MYAGADEGTIQLPESNMQAPFAAARPSSVALSACCLQLQHMGSQAPLPADEI